MTSLSFYDYFGIDLSTPESFNFKVDNAISPKDVKLEAENGNLVVHWTRPETSSPVKNADIGHTLPGTQTSYTYHGRLHQGGRKLVYKFSAKATSYIIPKSICNPTEYYYAEVYAETEDGELSIPIRSKRKMLYTVLEKDRLYVDNSLRLRRGYKVFMGYLKGPQDVLDPVAVKIIDVENIREIRNLQRLSKSPSENVVSYRACGKTEDPWGNMYIAMELCHQDTLYEIVEGKTLAGPDLKKVMVHMLRGLSFIHKKKILHRDLKPQNILRSMDGRCIKVADFGISKEIKPGQSRVSRSAREVGTDGWGSPEHYSGSMYEMSQRSDIFSAGLVSCFVLSGGKHACGEEEHHWKSKIIKWEPITLPLFDEYCDEPILAEKMICQMLEYEPDKRPSSADQVLLHPFFWDNSTKLEFFHRVWEYLEPYVRKKDPKEADIIGDQILKDLRADEFTIATSTGVLDWHEKMRESGVMTFILKKASGKVPRFKYNYQKDSLIELIHFIRNIEEHYKYHTQLVNLFKKERKNIWPFFAKIFPDLLSNVYEAFHKHWPDIQECADFSDDLGKFFTTPAPYEELEPFGDSGVEEVPNKKRKIN